MQGVGEYDLETIMPLVQQYGLPVVHALGVLIVGWVAAGGAWRRR